MTTQGETKQAWSKPVPYDLTRTLKRASVPKKFTNSVPESSGTYAIYRLAEGDMGARILDIGEAGPRSKSTPHGLRGRLATTVAHSASERMAADISSGKMLDQLCVVWYETASKSSAKDLQDALLTLFRGKYGRQPVYNTKLEEYQQPSKYLVAFDELKKQIEFS